MYYIKQIGEKDCGFTALKMLLATIHKDRNYLFYREFEKDYSLSLKNIIDIAKKENVNLEGFNYQNKEALFKEKPKYSLAIIEDNNKLHMVFVKKIKNNSIILYDPEYGKIKYSKKEFIQKWNGQILIVKNYLKKKFDVKIRNSEKIHNLIFSLLIVISHVLFLTSLYFVKSNNNFLIPLLIFLAYLLFNLFIENSLINLMYKIDKNIKKILLNRKNDRYKTYVDLTNYKVNYFTRNINITNSIMTFLSGCFILGINSYLNLIIILIILFIKILINLLFNNMKKKKKIELIKLENSLKNNQNFNDKDYDKITKNTYDILRIEEVSKIITIGLIFFITILLTSFQKTITLNFLLFHFFAFLFLNDSLDKLFIYFLDPKDNKYYLNLRRYYDNNY